MNSKLEWYYKYILPVKSKTAASLEEIKMHFWYALAMASFLHFLLWSWIGLFHAFKELFYEGPYHPEFPILLASASIPILWIWEEMRREVICENCEHKGIDKDIVYHGQFVAFGPHANSAARSRFDMLIFVNSLLIIFAFFSKLETTWPYIAYILVSILIQTCFRCCCSKNAEYTRMYDILEEKKKTEEKWYSFPTSSIKSPKLFELFQRKWLERNGDGDTVIDDRRTQNID